MKTVMPCEQTQKTAEASSRQVWELDTSDREGTAQEEALFPPPELVQREVSAVLDRKLSPDLEGWIEQYSVVGSRDPYLWRWCCCGVDVTTLPCVLPDRREELGDTKVLGVMLDVLLDDVADQGGEATLLECLLSIPYGQPSDSILRFSSDDQAYVRFTAQVWEEIQRRVRRYPRFDEYAALLRYDYLQLLNVMRYSHLLNADLALLNNPTDGEGPYCRRTGQTLTVQVHNQGEAGTGGGQLEVRITWVDTGATQTQSIAVDLHPGQTQEFTFQIPADCYGWSESCSFHIEIDPDNRISESNTSNNSSGGLCYGDAQDDEDEDW